MSQLTRPKPAVLRLSLLTWVLLAAAAAVAAIALVLALSMAGGSNGATSFPPPRSLQPQFDTSKGHVYTPDPYTYNGGHEEGNPTR
jgi:hypothetical protein